MRQSLSQKEISVIKPPTQRPLTVNLIDILDDNLSDVEIDDFDDTMLKLQLEEELEKVKKNLR